MLIRTKAAITRLRAYKPPPFPLWDRLPVSRRAAVLMLLYADRKGDLRVVITMRAASLRSFSGRTSQSLSQQFLVIILTNTHAKQATQPSPEEKQTPQKKHPVRTSPLPSLSHVYLPTPNQTKSPAAKPGKKSASPWTTPRSPPPSPSNPSATSPSASPEQN